jgi:multicomponent Na+:H+ antiporter subunit D
MLLAMGFLAFMCILLGVYPAVLYNLLPNPVDYVPYTAEHVVWTMQIMMFTALGFFLLLKYVGGEPYITLDTDWFYRKGGKVFDWIVFNPIAKLGKLTEKAFFEEIPHTIMWYSRNPLAAIELTGRSLMNRDVSEDMKRYPNIPIKMEVVSNTALLALLFFTIYIVIVLTFGGVSRIGGVL